MEKARIILWILVGVMSMGGFATMYRGAGGNPADLLMQKRLEQAVLSAEMGIECGFSDSGFLHLSASQAVKIYLELLEVSAVEMENLYGESRQKVPKPLPHIIGLPGKPWTIVLQPDDEHKLIRLFGFGDDANVPLLRKEILCE